MMRWLLGVMLFACSSPRPEPAPVVGSGSAPRADAAVAVVVDAPEHATPPTPASACTLRGEWGEQPRGLSFSDGGKPYGEVSQITKASATFGDGVFVEATTPSVRIGGFVDKSKVVVYAAKPFTVGDYAAPGPQIAMRFVSAKDDRMMFELPLPSYAKPKAPLRAERECHDLAIDDKTAFDPRDAIDAPTESKAHLHANRSIPLSTEPGKPPVVELRYESSPAVDVLEKRGKLARVAIEISALDPAYHVILFGWIPVSALHKQSTGFGGSWARGGDRMPPRGPPMRNTKFVSCSSEAPLEVEFAGERRHVGVVLPNVVIELLSDGDFVEVRFPRPNVELADGARWLVKRAALAKCAAAAAP